MTEHLPSISRSRDIATIAAPSTSLIGRGLVSIQNRISALAVADRDTLYRKARDAYNRITCDGSISGFGDVWTPEELIELQTACETFQRLADDGYGKAYFPLFLIYMGGQGVAEDLKRCRAYCKRALDWCAAKHIQDDPEIWSDWDVLAAFRIISSARLRSLAAELTPERRRVLLKAARNTAVMANRTYKQARIYELGLGVERNLEQAVRYYRQAADQGHAGAKVRLRELGIGSGNP